MMQSVIEKMTPAWYIATLNENFLRLNDLAGGGALLTTLTAAMTTNELKIAYDNNVNAINAIATVPISALTFNIGMRGLTIKNNLNSNSSNLAASLLNNIAYPNSIYVSNSGNDTTGNGTVGNPYATLVKVSTVLTDNTKIYLNKGSVFVNDKLDLSGKNNVIVDSYGSGAKPKLTGLKSVTGWTNEGGNIWSKQDAAFPDEITNVFIGGTKATLARTAAWKTASAGTNTTLTDSTLTDADGYWDNAELVVRYYVWCIGISRVSAYASKRFTIPAYDQDYDYSETGMIFPVAAGLNYFIQNHRNCLTTQDQWAFNNSTKTLYIYSVAEPANITATYGDDCIYADDTTNLTIQNIEINGSARCGINILNGFEVTIDSVDFYYSGYSSILLKSITELVVSNCTGTDQNSDFVFAQYCENVTITDNVIDKCGYVLGTERYLTNYLYGGMAGNGVSCHFSINVQIKYNEISNPSYDGVFLNWPSGYLVQYNYIHDVNPNKSDGGAIYVQPNYLAFVAGRKFFSQGGRIINNILTHGNLYAASQGVYLESDTKLCEVANNFIYKFIWNIQCHNVNNNNIHDNTIIADGNTDADIKFSVDYAADINNVIDNNLFVNIKPSTKSISVSVADVRNEVIKNNKYYYPFGKAGTGSDNTMFLIAAAWKTLSEWIADNSRVNWTRTGETEITPSLFAGSSKPEADFLTYVINPAKTVKTVMAAELPYNDYLDMDGVAQTYPFTLQPYTGKVLVRPN